MWNLDRKLSITDRQVTVFTPRVVGLDQPVINKIIHNRKSNDL